MSRAGEHRAVIERRGRSHRACCACGWTGHAWNELRPAEADAWHHVFGDGCVIDVSWTGVSVHSASTEPAFERLATSGRPGGPAPEGDQRSRTVENVVNRARALADSRSPYSHQAVRDLWRCAAEDQAVLQSAISEISNLLWQHSQRSAGTADSEWLQLITAKRLLHETMEQKEIRSYS
jgi:hypothetical protein